MRIPGFIIALMLATSPAYAGPKVAVFDFELVDTSLQGEVDGPRTDEQRRLVNAGDQARCPYRKSHHVDERRFPWQYR